MPPASSSSFIPKRNPGAKPKRPAVKSIFLLSVISYSLIIAAPLASVGVFIYQLQSQKNSDEALAALDQAIKSFNVPDYMRLLEFNDRLNTTQLLNDGHVSIATVFDIVSKATAETVKFESFDLQRSDIDTVTIKASLKTSAFDGALFQRGQYDAQSMIDTTAFSDVEFTTAESASEAQASSQTAEKVVSLKAEFNFSTVDIKYTPLAAYVAPVFVPVLETSPDASTETATTTPNETTP